MTAYELALAVCKALDGKNARDIGIIKVEGRSDITDYLWWRAGIPSLTCERSGKKRNFSLKKRDSLQDTKKDLRKANGSLLITATLSCTYFTRT